MPESVKRQVRKRKKGPPAKKKAAKKVAKKKAKLVTADEGVDEAAQDAALAASIHDDEETVDAPRPPEPELHVAPRPDLARQKPVDPAEISQMAADLKTTIDNIFEAERNLGKIRSDVERLRRQMRLRGFQVPRSG